MRKVGCDECKKEDHTKYSGSVPPGWCDIRITGNIVMPGKTYNQRVGAEIMLCDDCVTKKFDFSEEKQKPISEQFEDIATEYLQELSADAVQQAMENA